MRDTAPILVYATDAAMQAEPAELSEALRMFVKHDNRLFKQELIQETPPREDRKRASEAGHGENGGPSGIPAGSPPKRHQRESSIDSIATNRASMGDVSDREDFTPEEDVDAARDEDIAMRLAHSYRLEDTASDGGVGTEMVQLDLSREGSDAARNQTDPAGEVDQDIQVVADWDHPEGKKVRAQSPRAHFYQ